jgi:hypothetical protein
VYDDEVSAEDDGCDTPHTTLSLLYRQVAVVRSGTYGNMQSIRMSSACESGFCEMHHTYAVSYREICRWADDSFARILSV